MTRAADISELTGAQKAAILMLAMGEAHCARLFERMHEDEIRDVSSAMAQLGAIRPLARSIGTRLFRNWD